MGFALEIHYLTTRIGKPCLLFISWVKPTLRVAATATCPFPPRQAGGRLGWGGFVDLGKSKFVQPAESPSPQPFPAGRERGRVAG